MPAACQATVHAVGDRIALPVAGLAITPAARATSSAGIPPDPGNDIDCLAHNAAFSRATCRLAPVPGQDGQRDGRQLQRARWLAGSEASSGRLDLPGRGPTIKEEVTRMKGLDRGSL